MKICDRSGDDGDGDGMEHPGNKMTNGGAEKLKVPPSGD
jgi:hypothetical protein